MKTLNLAGRQISQLRYEREWTPDRIESLRDDLLGKGRFDTGIPPFLPPVGWE